jgi:hypothetical protein
MFVHVDKKSKGFPDGVGLVTLVDFPLGYELATMCSFPMGLTK